MRLVINVETEKIEEREFQKFSCRKIYVGNERLGVFSLCHPIKILYESLDSTATQPAHNSGGNFIADGIAKHRRVTGALPHSLADTRFNRPGSVRIIQECDVLFPGQSHHDSQVRALPRIQEPPGRDIIGPYVVDPYRRHPLETLINQSCLRLFGAVPSLMKVTSLTTPSSYLFFAS